MSKSHGDAQAALESAKERVRSDYSSMGADDASELASRILASFQSAFDRPPREEFEMILQRNFSEDEVRVCMFAPTEDQIKFYPALMTAANAPEVDKLDQDHALKKLKPLMLSLVFLLHRHAWKSFMEEFIVRGGLDILSTMLTEPNLYYRGQVVEIMVTATDCDVYDWFVPRTDIMGRTLHIRLLELSNHPTFLPNLLANRTGSYPGGSMRCLTLMAFWLSWVRAMYTKDQVLQLSPGMVTALKKWGREPGRDEDGNIDLSDIGEAEEDQIIEVGGGSGGDDKGEEEEGGDIKDERSLVKTLLQDFTEQQFQGKVGYSQQQQASSSSSPSSSSSLSEAVTASVSGITAPEADAEVKEKVQEVFGRISDSQILAFQQGKPTQAQGQDPSGCSSSSLPPVPPSSASTTNKTAAAAAAVTRSTGDLKAEGNRLFGYGDYLGALTSYDQAVAAGTATTAGAGDKAEDEADLLSSLYFNRAACYWKVATKLAPALLGSSSKDKEAGGKRGKEEEEDEYMNMALKQAGLGGGDGSNELTRCEEECRACLSLSPDHYKASYRLAAVLLAMKKPSAALETAEAAIRKMGETDLSSSSSGSSGSNATLQATFASLKELRSRCLAACMVQNRKSNSNGGSKSSKEGTPQDQGVLSGPAAKILQALQRRKDRERKKEIHAEGSGEWSPPAEDQPYSARDDRSSSNNGVGSSSSSKKQDGDRDVDVGEYFGQSNVYTGSSSSSSKAKKVAVASASAVDAEEEKRKKEKAAAKQEAKKASRSRLLQALEAIRGAVRTMETAGYSAEAVQSTGPALIAALQSAQAAGSSSSSSSKKKSNNNNTLSQAFKDASFMLDEARIVACLLSLDHTGNPSEHLPLLKQLTACERFSSVLGMALFGNDALKAAISSLVGKCREQGMNDVAAVLST